jgi:uncharacterized protein YjaZ
MTEDRQALSAGHPGQRNLRYSEDSLINISLSEGLAKNFCYSIISDKTNKLWVTHFPDLVALI